MFETFSADGAWQREPQLSSSCLERSLSSHLPLPLRSTLQRCVDRIEQSPAAGRARVLKEAAQELAAFDSILLPLAQFDPQGYVRLLLLEGRSVDLLLMGWMPGQSSAVHDHGGEPCALRILQGEAWEQIFVSLDEDHQGACAVEPALGRKLEVGETVIRAGHAVHAMGCAETSPEPLVSFHIYPKRPRSPFVYGRSCRPAGPKAS